MPARPLLLPLLLLTALLGGCVQPRPAGPGSAALPAVAGVLAPATLGAELRQVMAAKAAAVPRVAPERAMADLPSRDEGRLAVLALAGSAPDGAFAAGFLAGWPRQGEPARQRPAHEVVVGIGQGALLATHAFLGASGDDLALRALAIALADMAEPPSLLRALASGGLRDPAPRRRLLAGLITPGLLDRVAAATAPDPATGAPGRFLLALAVNLDRGAPRLIDLGAIARDGAAPDRAARYLDAVLAAASSPVEAAPAWLDGELHGDGGLRQALGLIRYLEAQRVGITGLAVLPPRLDLILDQAPPPGAACTEPSLAGIGARATALLLDPLAFDSLYRLAGEAERLDVDLRYASAAQIRCPAGAAGARCRLAQGAALAGAAADPWQRGRAQVPDGGPPGLVPAAVCPAG
jgi:hypothetical protein